MSKHIVFRRGFCLVLSLLLFVSAGHVSRAVESSVERSETVYVTSDAEGTPTSVMSSVYLLNPDGREKITDASTLTDVRNVMSNGMPQQDNGWVFVADGEDVCYQGVADAAQLPIAMSVTYALDGVPMTAEEIAGKSGLVRVTVSYENRKKNTVDIDGEAVELYTPFTVVTMIEVDDGFRRVAVENAKLMSEAGSTMVVGIIFPGLAANLETDATDMLSESFSFEAKVNDFAMESIMAVVVPDLLDADDLNSLDDVESFVDGMDELTDAGDQLEKGTANLYYGMRKFTDGLSSYLGGIRSLGDGIRDVESMLENVDYEEVAAQVLRAYQSLRNLDQNISSAKASVSSAKSHLSGIADLDPEQQAAVDAAMRDLESASSDLDEVDRELSELESLLQGLDLPDVSSVMQGLGQFADGINALVDNADAIENGAVSIRKGTWSLYKGMREFNNEGLQKITEETEGIAGAAERKDAMLDLSEAYTAYSAENVVQGSVKFVITTESIYVPKIEAPTTPAPQTDGEVTSEPAAEETQSTIGAVIDRFGEFFDGLFGR